MLDKVPLLAAENNNNKKSPKLIIVIKPEWYSLGVKVSMGLGPCGGLLMDRWIADGVSGCLGLLWAPGLVCPGLACAWL